LDKNAETAVMVITYNGRHHLKECIDALLRQTSRNFEIYLVDNASADGSSVFVIKNYPQVKIIQHDKNYGFAEGYNRAIKHVNSKYIALLNDDTKVDPEWLEELTKAMNKDSKILAVGSKIFFYSDPSLLQHAGGKLTLIGAGIDIGFGDQDKPIYNEPKFVGTVCGGAMMVQREIYENIGGFDDRYFAYFEDVDLCWRAWLQGYKTVYVPTSIVYHKFGGSWGTRHSHNRVYYGTKNRFASMIKNFGIKNLMKGLYLSIFLDVYRVLLFLLKKKPENVRSILRAHCQTLKNLPRYLITRFHLQAKRKLSDKNLFDLGLFLSFPESLHEYRRLKEADFS
jgi:GT2 family glycosyltransferase